MSNNKSFIEEALVSEYADPDPAFDGEPPAMGSDPPSVEDIPGVGASGADVEAIPGVGDSRQSARVDDIAGVGELERAFGGMPMLADGSDPDADEIPGTSGGGFGAGIGSDDSDGDREQPPGTEAGFAASDGDKMFSGEDAQAGREAVADGVRSAAERVRDRVKSKGGSERGRRRTVGSVRRKDSSGGIVGAIREKVGGGGGSDEGMDSTRVVGSFGSSNDNGDDTDGDREGLDASEVELDDENDEDDDDSDDPSTGRRGLDASEVDG